MVSSNLPKFKLISFALCPYVQRARNILLEKGIPHEITYIELDKPPRWFEEISPLGKVPVLLVNDTPLFESLPICEYLDEITDGSLYPRDAFLKAQNRAWIEFGNEVLNLTYQLFTVEDNAVFQSVIDQLHDRFERLEGASTTGPYFNDDQFCIIDAVYAPIFRFHLVLSKYHDFKFFDNLPKIRAWSKELLHRPSVQQSVPETYADDLSAYLLLQESVLAKWIRHQTQSNWWDRIFKRNVVFPRDTEKS